MPSLKQEVILDRNNYFINFDVDFNTTQLTMQREIERKFLLKNMDFTKEEGIAEMLDIKQGYLSKDFGKVVRVRRTYFNQHNHVLGMLTIKIKTGDAAGVDEYEYQIPEDEAEKLLNSCDWPILEKTRYIINYKETIWEVDVFHGHKAGLILAEVEVESADQAIEIPDWIGEEVTGQAQYYNANM